MASPASLRMLPQTPSPIASLLQFLVTMEQVRRMRIALAHQESGGSPLKALDIMSENTDVLSPNILKASRFFRFGDFSVSYSYLGITKEKSPGSRPGGG